jgi:anti-anti-sigma factor
MMQCRISSFEDLVLVRLKGRCTFSSVSEFEKALDAVWLHPPCTIEVEMSELEYIDSSGVGMLLMLQEVCEKKTSRLVLKHPATQILSVLRLTRLDQLFTIGEG